MEEGREAKQTGRIDLAAMLARYSDGCVMTESNAGKKQKWNKR